MSEATQAMKDLREAMAGIDVKMDIWVFSPNRRSAWLEVARLKADDARRITVAIRKGAGSEEVEASDAP
ncbi:hypothetical protein [Streptomyces rhizosphaericus]|uniref:Uncharacterized protein n=1 Tax=Streptomyces rhizosphaericus TaxID=114699 RepID=A0A6G4AI53_9ACTN|nr:hypothetical protein [Streptomyces rhizosphaericus]NEW72484.1 hypothetical protein [Streptomyces rhizosphaericus]